jgi:hypothetical protein
MKKLYVSNCLLIAEYTALMLSLQIKDGLHVGSLSNTLFDLYMAVSNALTFRVFGPPGPCMGNACVYLLRIFVVTVPNVGNSLQSRISIPLQNARADQCEFR